VPAEIFASNRAMTTVSSGGTDAPSSGTSESWTVATSAGFPTPASGATPPTVFHIADPAAPSEMITVTAISGTTWTVTRGAESTTPVTHTAGFTVYQVVTTGGLGGFLQSANNLADVANATTARANLGITSGTTGGTASFGLVPVATGTSGTTIWGFVGAKQVSFNAWNPDSTGASFCDAAMGSALTSLGTASGAIVIPVAGKYKFANTYTFGLGQGLIGAAGPSENVVLNYTGGTVFLHSYDAAFNVDNTTPLQSQCGPFNGFFIDGTGAGSAAIGFQIGDQNLPNVNIGIRDFTGAKAVGAWICNNVGWINYGQITISTESCTNHIVFDNTTSGSANGGVIYAFNQTALENQNGVIMKNDTQSVGGAFMLYGEYLGGTSNSGVVLNVGSDNSNSGFTGMSPFIINAEAAFDTGTVGHTTINRGSSAILYDNYGQLVFRNQSANFKPSTGIDGAYQFSFNGSVLSQATSDFLPNPGVNGFASVTMGGTLETPSGADTGGGNIYNGSGSVLDIQLASGANVYAIANPITGMAQRLVANVTQPASGGSATLKLTGFLTNGGGGTVTGLSATNGFTDALDLWSDGTNWYAAIKGTHFH